MTADVLAVRDLKQRVWRILLKGASGSGGCREACRDAAGVLLAALDDGRVPVAAREAVQAIARDLEGARYVAHLAGAVGRLTGLESTLWLARPELEAA